MTILASRPPARTTKPRRSRNRRPGHYFPLFQRGKVRLRREGRGAVAQLGERRNGIAKVRGSIPLGSTTSSISFAFAGALTLPLLERRRLPQRAIADAVIEADPVNPVATACRVAVAKLNPPPGRSGLRDEA